MSDIDVFVIEDDFDPLADLELGVDEEQPATDYLPPIPDAELSRVPDRVPLPPTKRIEKLLAGIPGQQFRILHAVECCSAEPKTMEEIVEDVDEAHPNRTSVYDVAQIVQLLEGAGALERVESKTASMTASSEAKPSADAEADEPVEDEDGYLSVKPASPCRYAATQAGLDAVSARINERVVIETITEEERYLPLYRRIFSLVSCEGGCSTKELDRAIDDDPLCEEPRRFCGYFLGRLEHAGAVQWRDSWILTDLGRKVLESDVFE